MTTTTIRTHRKIKGTQNSFDFPGSLFSRDKKSNLIAAQNLREKLGETSPNIIHSHSATPSRVAKTYSSLASERVPIIQTMHGWGSYKSLSQEKDDVSILNDVEHVVSISKALLHFLKRRDLTIKTLALFTMESKRVNQIL